MSINRCSCSEWSGSSMVMENGSPKTDLASSKPALCFLRFSSAFLHPIQTAIPLRPLLVSSLPYLFSFFNAHATAYPSGRLAGRIPLDAWMKPCQRFSRLHTPGYKSSTFLAIGLQIFSARFRRSEIQETENRIRARARTGTQRRSR